MYVNRLIDATSFILQSDMKISVISNCEVVLQTEKLVEMFT